MSHRELIERTDHLEIRSPMRTGMRVVLAVLALVPLLAPYELLVRAEWQRYMHPVFFFVAAISAGAIAVSALLLFAAIGGLSSEMVFDTRAQTFVHSSKAPVIRRRSQSHPLSQVRTVEVGARDWSDSAPTYHLRIVLADGAVFESGSSASREDIESLHTHLQRFLADGDPSSSTF